MKKEEIGEKDKKIVKENILRQPLTEKDREITEEIIENKITLKEINKKIVEEKPEDLQDHSEEKPDRSEAVGDGTLPSYEELLEAVASSLAAQKRCNKKLEDLEKKVGEKKEE